MSFFKQYSKPLDNPDLRVLSLGAGVQSSVMALLAARGDIGPMPDCAIFADTQWEPRAVYTHLAWLETQLPFPVHHVTAGNIRTDVNRRLDGERFVSLPMFLSNGGMGRRQCTNEYKIQPIIKKVRELLGLVPGEKAKKVSVEQWIGISTDEFQRMKVSRKKWITHRWPLLEQEIDRKACEAWFSRHYPGRTLVKSACIGCPYHTNNEWRKLTPNEFAQARAFEQVLINDPTLDARQYLHAQRVPLGDVDLSTKESAGQINWLDECEGMCGV